MRVKSEGVCVPALIDGRGGCGALRSLVDAEFPFTRPQEAKSFPVWDCGPKPCHPCVRTLSG